MSPSTDDTFWDPEELKKLREEQGVDRPVAYLPLPLYVPQQPPLRERPEVDSDSDRGFCIIDM